MERATSQIMNKRSFKTNSLYTCIYHTSAAGTTGGRSSLGSAPCFSLPLPLPVLDIGGYRSSLPLLLLEIEGYRSSLPQGGYRSCGGVGGCGYLNSNVR